jgi:ATP-binding cassette subfamily B protein/ATP-binding cassette subfamily C protein
VFNSRFEKIRFAKHLKSLCIKYDNIKELKIFNATNFIKQKILEIYTSNIQQDKKIRKNFLVQTSLFDSIDNLFSYIIKGIVIYISFVKCLTIGSVITYIQGVDVLKGAMKNIMSMITKTYEDSLYMQNYFSLLSIKTESEDGKKEFETDFKRIEFINVSFQYPETKQYVLKNINFTFEVDKTYALVGLNGSGKTTLIKLLLNLYEVSSGEILIDGINIGNIKRSSLYKNVSAIFQDFIKYPFDVRTNITIGNENLNQDDKFINQVVDFAGAKDFIDNLPEHYDTKLQKEWSNSLDLSLGQWQKLAIARAAIRQASILILDEPTASIDAVTEYEIFNNFKFLKRNKLCILVTHRFSNIKIVDEILVLEDGMLKETGTHDALIKKGGVYKNLYTLQANAYIENKEFVSG